jgi:DNA mismatch repair ATPase MutS
MLKNIGGIILKMSVLKVIEEAKEKNLDSIILIKIGNFYKVYGKDAYIISYLFKYKLKKIDNTSNECGFPLNVINKIKKSLEERKINYVVLNNSNSSETNECNKFDKENMYKSFFEKAYKYIFNKGKIDLIYDYMLENATDDSFKIKLNQIEEILFNVAN